MGPGWNRPRITCRQAGSTHILPPMSSERAKAFVARWAAASASERANSQPFLCGLCDILEVALPEPTREAGYAFEYDVTEHHPDGSTTKGRIDLFKRGCFVLESKQFQAAKAAASQLELAAQEAGIRPQAWLTRPLSARSSFKVSAARAWAGIMLRVYSSRNPSIRAPVSGNSLPWMRFTA